MLETPLSSPVIKDCTRGGFAIGEDFFEGSIQINGREGNGFAITPWQATNPDALTEDDFSLFLKGDARPDLIVLGIGAAMAHPFAQLRMALTAEGIPLEVQTTAAACRTWNLLLSEGRHAGFAAIAVGRPSP